MMTSLLHSVQSELLKQKRSLVTWLVIGGGLFVPAIVLLIRLHRPQNLPAAYRSTAFWDVLWKQAWESISIMILPMVIILVISVLVHLEYRDNTWKQLHTSPQRPATIFAAKLIVILFVVFQLFVVFNVGLYLTAVIPALLFTNVPMSDAPLPSALFLTRNVSFFIGILPVVALQYLLSLRFRSFIAPLGIGMALWIFSVGVLNTQYNYVVPYGYAGVKYLIDIGYRDGRNLPANVHLLAAGWFIVLTIAGYLTYATRKDRG